MNQSDTHTDHQLQCIKLRHALSPCAGCGQIIRRDVHAPITASGLFCAGCCPCCAEIPMEVMTSNERE
jgi:hypothetical protein